MRGGDQFKPKPRQSKPINKESPKRKKENKRYRQRLEEKWEQSLADKTNKCIFCDEFMYVREDNHHIRGRGAFMLEEEFWYWAHRDCHDIYTHGRYEQLIKQPWYPSFLERLKTIDTMTYYRELKKRDKNLELNLDN